MEILIGTNNLNKFNGYKYAFSVFAPEIKLLKPVDLNITGDPQEDSDSLMGNAELKAKFFGEKSGLITLSDDTGLFVDALNGEPGVHAKRWHDGTEHDRCVKLLELLNGKNRDASYKWSVVAYNPRNKSIWSFVWEVKGLISDDFKEVGGFGYDKMFKLLSVDKYYSELTPDELLNIGGRQRAVNELVLNSNFLKS